MKKLIKILLALAFAFCICGYANAQSPYGVKKLKKLGQIGASGDTDSLLIYKNMRVIGTSTFTGNITIGGTISLGLSVIVQDTDSDSIIAKPGGFSATNSSAAGTIAFQVKDGEGPTSLFTVDTTGIGIFAGNLTVTKGANALAQITATKSTAAGTQGARLNLGSTSGTAYIHQNGTAEAALGGNNSLNILTPFSAPITFYSWSNAALMIQNASASVVNYLRVTGSITTEAVNVSTEGTDTNIGINLAPKGSGSVSQETFVLRKFVSVTGQADDANAAFFTVTTADETGSADGGMYSVKIHLSTGEAVAASGATNVSSMSGTYLFSRVMQSAGTGANSAVSEIVEAAGADAGTGAIVSIDVTVAETSEFVQQISLQVDTSGGTFDGFAIVEVVYSDFTTPPVIN